MDVIKNRWTGEVMLPGMTLKMVIERHRKWISAEEDGQRADLSGAVLSDADLRGAVLSNAPVKIENIHQRVYEAASKDGALDMYDWHTCETTHCRAGWVVALAGDAGKEMERMMGTAAAAAMIYIASDPNIGKMPDFYVSNDAALTDMRNRAESERQVS